MKNVQPVTGEYFKKRLTDLCLRSGLSGFPKGYVEQHILLKSVVLTLDTPGSLTEKEVNEKLKYWITHISQLKSIDHITLRRRLVDTGYLTRNADGSCYQVARSGPVPNFFDASIDRIDVLEVIKAGREEAARRKRNHMVNKSIKAGVNGNA